MSAEEELSDLAREANELYGLIPMERLIDLTFLAHSRLVEARSLNNDAKIKRCEYTFKLLYFLSKASIEKKLT